MKKIYIIAFILFSFIYITTNSITIGFENGIPIGVWGYELNNMYGFTLGFIYDFYFINPSVHIMLNSFNTNTYNYFVNAIKIPVALNIKIYERNNYTVLNYIGAGIAIYDKAFNNYHTYGYNEFIRINPYIRYKYNNKSFDFYLGYERQKIINGNNILFMGINLGFILY